MAIVAQRSKTVKFSKPKLRVKTEIEGQVLQSYIVIVLGNQRATILHDADDYTTRSADPKADTPIRHTPQLRPAQQPNRSACPRLAPLHPSY